MSITLLEVVLQRILTTRDEPYWKLVSLGVKRNATEPRIARKSVSRTGCEAKRIELKKHIESGYETGLGLRRVQDDNESGVDKEERRMWRVRMMQYQLERASTSSN